MLSLLLCSLPKHQLEGYILSIPRPMATFYLTVFNSITYHLLEILSTIIMSSFLHVDYSIRANFQTNSSLDLQVYIGKFTPTPSLLSVFHAPVILSYTNIKKIRIVIKINCQNSVFWHELLVRSAANISLYDLFFTQPCLFTNRSFKFWCSPI